jgi:hypothetical protein
MIIVKAFWREIVLAVLLVACVFAVLSARSSAKLAGEYKAERDTARADLKVCKVDAKVVQESLTAVQTARDDFEAKWKAARDKPSKVVTRIETVTKEIPTTITATDCEEAAAQALAQAQAFAVAW